MTKKAVLAASILGFAVLAPAVPKDADQRARRKKGPNPPVWMISGDRNTIYLAGSMHVLRAKDLPLPKAFNHAYEDSERLIFEIAPEEMESVEANALGMKLGTYEGERTIKDEVSEAAYKELGAYLEEAGLPPGAMDGFRPWMAMMAITMGELAKLGAVGEMGVESVIRKWADKDGKEIGGLESMELQFRTLSGFGAKLQERMLRETLKERKTLKGDFPKIVEMWRSGDGKGFMGIAFEDLGDPEAKPFYEKILFERNRNWVAPIEEILRAEENVMIVVGAGHLIGKGSVIDLLKKRGHKVRRLRLPEKRVPKEEPKKRDLVPVGFERAA